MASAFSFSSGSMSLGSISAEEKSGIVVSGKSSGTCFFLILDNYAGGIILVVEMSVKAPITKFVPNMKVPLEVLSLSSAKSLNMLLLLRLTDILLALILIKMVCQLSTLGILFLVSTFKLPFYLIKDMVFLVLPLFNTTA